MKKFVFLLIGLLCLNASAEVITMDLTTATDINATPITYSTHSGSGYYDCRDVWEETYNDGENQRYIHTNNGRFRLSHMPSMASYGGMSWEGFTLSKVAQDTANVFGCVANGGMQGVGTPYAIGYFSEWVTASQGYSSNIILFDQTYYPEYVYICQNSNTMRAIVHGDVFNARAFSEQDTLALIISALDSNMQEMATTTYYLAVDGQKNNGWVKVPLHNLGAAAGLSFRMTTTDIGDFGSNTPLYFALDALTVNTNLSTGVKNVKKDNTNAKKAWHKGQVLIIRGDKQYNLLGIEIGS
jgi:hypothetical protein